MAIVGGAEVTIGMVRNDEQRIGGGVETMQRFLRDDEGKAGFEREGTARRDTFAVAADDKSDSNGWVRVRRLLRRRRDMEQVQARVPESHRRNQERVGAAIDIPEPADLF